MKILYTAFALLFFLTACSQNIDHNKVIPTEVDLFAKEYISYIQNGDIDNCLANVVEQMQTDDGRTFLTNVSNNIKTFQLDSLQIINAQLTKLYGDRPVTTYTIEYEKELEENFIYFFFTIQNQNGTMKISEFDARGMKTSLMDAHQFTFKNKSITHYLFFLLAILSSGFIIFTLISAIRTPLKLKWIWIVGILFAFSKFKLDWSTGEFEFQPISFQLFGAGFSKYSLVAPWTLTFSIPTVAIAFWIKRDQQKKEFAEKAKMDAIIAKHKNNGVNGDHSNVSA